MPTNTLTVSDLNDHATDANLIISKIYTDLPISYRVKEIVVTNLIGSPTYSNTPTVTIASPLLPNGINATASASLIQQTDGTDVSRIVRIVVTNPGSGYNVVPSVTVTTGDTGGTTEAVAVLEIDPVVLDRRKQTIEIINTQIVEESINTNTTIISTKLEDIRLKLEDMRLETANVHLKLEDIRADFQLVLQEIRDSFDIKLANNFATIIQNIDNSVNVLLQKSKYNITGIVGTFILGENVSTSSGSGRVMHFDSLTRTLTIGNISGVFENSQTITGLTSAATARLIIEEDPPVGTTNDQIARGMMVLNLKATDTLDDLRQEIRNPTPI